MSVLVVGISHNSAPVALLERVALDADGVRKLIDDVAACEHVTEATVIATCNRLEIYADVDRFHGSVEELSRLLVERAGETAEAMLPHLYVHYDDGAVSHLFQVAAGLDSMAVGEGQILGQTRDALRARPGARHRRPRPQRALPAGAAGRQAGPRRDRHRQRRAVAGQRRPRPRRDADGDLAGRRVLVVGAGAMAGLATATVARRGAGRLAVVNRTAGTPTGSPGSTAPAPCRWPTSRPSWPTPTWSSPAPARPASIVPVTVVAAATAAGPSSTIIDLALPHDVDPEVADLPGVTLVDLADLADELRDTEAGREVDEVRRIVTQEVAAFLAARRQASVTPTVVALRSMATAVVDAEMERLASRLPDLDEATRAEVLHTVRRVADKLLHEPTVRVKELANEPVRSPTPTRWPSCSRSTPRPSTPSPDRRARHEPRPGRHPRLAARHHPVRPGRRPDRRAARPRGRAGRDHHRRRPQPGRRHAARGRLGHRRVRQRAARRAARGHVDVAVHSLKDLPTYAADGIALAAVPPREDPRDVVVARDGLTLGELPVGSRVGTGSPRRAAQLHALGLGVEVVGVRGNVDTRIAKVRSGEYDAVLLARAGLARIGRLDEVTEVLDPLQMLPAPGQGALAVECRTDDDLAAQLREVLDDPRTRAAVEAERAVLATLEGGCSAPIGALAEVVEGEDGEELWVRAVALSLDGGLSVRMSATGDPADAAGVGHRLAKEMLADGAAHLSLPTNESLDKVQNA